MIIRSGYAVGAGRGSSQEKRLCESRSVAAAKKEPARGIFILGPSWEGLGG
jgi:hypothetical protein